MEELKFPDAIEKIKVKIDWGNKYIDETKLWDLVKSDKEKSGEILGGILGVIIAIGEALAPIMPDTAEKIIASARAEKITKGEALWPRIK
jgi:methionyl-tRNA synthetase